MNASRAASAMTSVGSAMLCAVALLGCAQPNPPTGGDSPVTAQRLAGSRLVDIRRDVSWTFSEERVVVENAGQPIPADVAVAVLGEQRTCQRIDAAWRLDESRGELALSDISADSETTAREARVPIAPAGHVRANLGERQYNMLRGR